jgi:alkylation response protein AidB-like acyl-CoA dehydrogenase
MIAPELLERIAAGAAERERERRAPHAEVQLLREAGVGALRVPADEGGAGASLPALFEVVMDLSHADTNIGHLLRAHFGAVEDILLWPDGAGRRTWIERIVAGAIIGVGNNELVALHAGDLRKTTTLTPDGDGWILQGTKFYSTGTLYSDWSFVTAVTPEGTPAFAFVPTDREGVTVEDDWDGFGQRLTASGTTRFDGVRVHADEVMLPPADAGGPRWHLGPFYQHYLNAVVAGNLRSVLDDAIALVAGRTRSFTHGSADLPREDPVLLEVVGEISANVAAAEALIRETAGVIARIGEAPGDDDVIHEAALRASQAQVAVDALGLSSADLLFEVGGASATRQGADLDRHWRNIRTIASHNPARFKNRAIGDLLVNGARLPDNTYF